MGLFGDLFSHIGKTGGGAHRKKGATRAKMPATRMATRAKYPGGRGVSTRVQLAGRSGGRNPTAKQMKGLWWR